MASSSTSTAIGCGGTAAELRNHNRRRLVAGLRSIQMARFSSDVSDRRLRQLGTAAAERGRGSGGERGIVAEKLDEWMRDSVTEIVKNLTEAPLLVQVYSDEKGRKLETEKAVEEGDWKRLIEKWKKRDSPLPEGVIFVEQLHDGGEEATKAWGIVVQGKGAECGPVCYLLKTSRVGSSGLGLCCTHFCLMRVKGFRESAKSQLKNCWLLQAQYDRVF
ncbi:unnamed protein product [Linum tenue]|uniref:DUF7804 domain-containing protein n=2 Tax=Linum tenue TaxID=586396 RepID=A0AAV0NLS1_9ROSI|nr:unnamed protein product [Linum tenue]